MSGRIFPLGNLSPANVRNIFTSWSEVWEERGSDAAVIGIMQLVLDILHQTRVNENVGAFTLPDGINLHAFNMENYMNSQVENKMFDVRQQKEWDDKLFGLMWYLIKKSGDLSWFEHIRRWIRVFLKNTKTAFLVIKTVVHLYVEAVNSQNDSRLSDHIKQQLQTTSAFFSQVIANEELPFSVSLSICDKFFDQITQRFNVTQIDGNGCIQIIATLIRSEFVKIKTGALTRVIQLVNSRVHGTEMVDLCSNDAIIHEIITILTIVKQTDVRKHALELACLLQRANRERVLFNNEVFKDFVLSDLKGLQRLSTELLRLTVRDANGNINSSDVLIRATVIYRRFRRDVTHCPKRLVRLFYTEFTDWEAVFRAVQLRLADDEFIKDFFCLLKRVFEQIKSGQNKAQVENLLRSYLIAAIQFLNTLDRQHVRVYIGVIFTLVILDDHFELVNQVHLTTLASIVSEICTGYIHEFPHQRNIISLFATLIKRKYIRDEVRHSRVNQCVNELNALKTTLETGGALETNQNVMRTFMTLAVFAFHQMISENAVVLCNSAHALIMTERLDFNQNRTLLGYGLIITVYAYIDVIFGAHSLENTTPGVSDAGITARLLDICDRTEDDLDFLSRAVFWCLVQMEMRFGSVIPRKGANFFNTFIMKKISLVNVSPEDGVNFHQLDHVHQMLGALQVLISPSRDIDLREIVVALHKKFPDYDFVSDMLTFCGTIGKMNMLSSCVVGVLDELATKKSKKEFIEKVERLVDPLPNKNAIRAHIIRESINQFGKRKQESLAGPAAKQAKQVMEVLNNTSLKNITF